MRVRLIGIDTPEVNQDECFAAEASRHLAALVPPGTVVRLVYDVERFDRYGRTLAYLFRVDHGVHVNVAMAADGFAHQLTVPPTVAHADEFGAAVAAARQAGRGLWGAGCQSAVPVPPAGAPPGSAESPSGSCDPSYPTLCIPPGIPDLDCPDITERAFLVLPPDPHRFDGNHDNQQIAASPAFLVRGDGKAVSMASDTRTSTDHDEIRRWVEDHEGRRRRNWRTSRPTTGPRYLQQAGATHVRHDHGGRRGSTATPIPPQPPGPGPGPVPGPPAPEPPAPTPQPTPQPGPIDRCRAWPTTSASESTRR